MLNALRAVLPLEPDLPIQVITHTDQLPAVEAGAVLALGKAPQDHLASLKAVPKGRTITSLRGRAWTVAGLDAPVLFSYSPAIGEIDYARHIDLLCDTRMAMRLARTGSLVAEVDTAIKEGRYRYVTDFRDFWFQVEESHGATGKPVEVAFDTETLGLDPYAPGAYVVSLQACWRPGYVDMIHFPSAAAMKQAADSLEFMEPLAALFQSPKVSLRMANGKFDIHWMREHFHLTSRNFRFDTTLVGSLLDENRSNGLDVHAKIYTPLGGYSDLFDRTVDKSRMDLVSKAALLAYGAPDADATLQSSRVMKQQLMDDGPLCNFYVNLLHPAARAYERVEATGVWVDKEAYDDLENELTTAMAGCVARTKRVVNGRVLAKHYDPEGLNITKASFLCDFMFSPMGLNLKPKMLTEKTAEPSTAMDHLLMFEKEPKAAEFVAILKEYQSAAKTLSTYVTGFRKHLRSDGRFHPSYYLHRGNKDEGEGGTNTGRLSCKDPAFQTLPKHTKWAKKLRKCFVAPPGMVILSFDYSQGELRVIACIAGEANMIRAYRDDMDLHSLTAGRFKGFTYGQMMAMKAAGEGHPDYEKWEAIRQLGKAGNFGLIYGMGVDGFVIYAEQNYGVVLPAAEANDFRNGFFDSYPGLLTYHREYKGFARKHGYVRTPLGRVRHLPLINSPRNDISSKAERQAINAPVQGTLSDLALLFAGEYERRGWMDWAPMFGMVHDQNLMYCPEEKVIDHAKQVKQLAENLPLDQFGWAPQLTFVADTTYGPNLADQKKIK